MPPRLHKVLGYALTDLATTPDPDLGGLPSIDDPRINPESPLMNWEDPEDEEEPEGLSLAGYAAWLNDECSRPDHPLRFLARMESRLVADSLERKRHYLDINHAVVHRPETGHPGVLVLIPPAWLHRFRRSDDCIDMAEWRQRPNPRDLSASLTVLTAGIGPYSTRFMDMAGVELTEAAAEFELYASEGMPEEELDRLAGEIRPVTDREGAQLYPTAAEVRARMVPAVPMDLRRLAAYGQLFTSNDVWKQLRPVLYTYWA